MKEVQPDTGLMVERSRYESSFSLSLSPSTNSTAKTPLMMQFSKTSTFLAAVSSEYPNCIWIVNLSSMCIVAVLHQANNIRSISWHDSHMVLTILTTRPGSIYLWEPSGCMCIPQPAISDPRSLSWLDGLETLLIAGSSSFTLASPEWVSF